MSDPVTAVDAHAHVFDPARFPYAPEASYHPAGQEIGTVERYLAVLDAHGVSHAILVQPTSGYLFDHRCLLDALDRGGGRLRAVLRIPPARPQPYEQLLAHPRAVGVRLDLMADGVDVVDAPDAEWLLDAMRERGLTLHIQCEREQLVRALPLVRRAKAPVVFDHCGRPDPTRGLDQPGFAELLALARDGHAVKLSGPFRFSRESAPHRDVEPFVFALLDAYTPDRCLWGSDWPFLRMGERLDYGPALAQLEHWVENPAARTRILCDTPGRIYGLI